MSDIVKNNDQEKPPKNQWLWLIGLCLGGMIFMYLLAKATRVFVSFLGLN